MGQGSGYSHQHVFFDEDHIFFLFTWMMETVSIMYEVSKKTIDTIIHLLFPTIISTVEKDAQEKL